MSDPRERVDARLAAYASEDACDFCHDQTRGEIAPRVFAALRAVLELHKPEPVTHPATSNGSCSACVPGEPPLRVILYKFDSVRGSGEVELHEHPDTSDSPKCDHCVGGEDDETWPIPWPCLTVQAIVQALEAK